jgi:hypothetical protein
MGGAGGEAGDDATGGGLAGGLQTPQEAARRRHPSPQLCHPAGRPRHCGAQHLPGPHAGDHAPSFQVTTTLTPHQQRAMELIDTIAV